MMSLAVTPKGRSPSTVMRKVFGLSCGRVWVAMTCSTSEVPMPKARAPKAPWVLVWESPQTMVMPGLVAPSSGPIMWTMPCSGVLHVVELDAELGAVPAEGFDLPGGDGVEDVEAVLDAGGGDVVVDGGDGAVGAAELATGHAEAVEGLRAGDLVDEVEVDVEDGGLACGGGDEVLVPEFFEEGVLGSGSSMMWSAFCSGLV